MMEDENDTVNPAWHVEGRLATSMIFGKAPAQQCGKFGHWNKLRSISLFNSIYEVSDLT
jgi:hypothetical protein